jgi:hypothetical protein
MNLFGDLFGSPSEDAKALGEIVEIDDVKYVYVQRVKAIKGGYWCVMINDEDQIESGQSPVLLVHPETFEENCREEAIAEYHSRMWRAAVASGSSGEDRHLGPGIYTQWDVAALDDACSRETCVGHEHIKFAHSKHTSGPYQKWHEIETELPPLEEMLCSRHRALLEQYEAAQEE